MKSFFAIGILFSFILLSCRTQDELLVQEEIVTIKHGYTFGRCLGNCNKETTYTAGTMRYLQYSRDTLKNKPEMIEKKFATADFYALCKNIDLQAFLQLEERLGCPDCADQGAEYVEIITTNQKKRVTFEPGTIPAPLQTLLPKLRSNLTKLAASKKLEDK